MKDNDVLDYFRKRPCEVCNKPPPSDPCHIRSKGAGGKDEPENLMSLCREHHTSQHQMGLKSFVRKYNLPVDIVSIYPRRLVVPYVINRDLGFPREVPRGEEND